MVAMAPWETLLAGVAGGVVGVGGTCLGAWLTGRTQTANLKLSISAENERAHVAEKRRAYANCLAAAHAATHDAGFRRFLDAGGNQDVKLLEESAWASFKADRALTLAVAEVALIAPDNVADLAWAVAEAIFGSDKPFDDTVDDALDDLNEAMRADLGEPV